MRQTSAILLSERDQTRREHILEIERRVGDSPLTASCPRTRSTGKTALATDHGPTLVTTMLEELRARQSSAEKTGHRTFSGLGSSPRAATIVASELAEAD